MADCAADGTPVCSDRHISDSLIIDAIEVVDDGVVDLLAIIKKVNDD
jgi:hypothetical protein